MSTLEARPGVYVELVDLWRSVQCVSRSLALSSLIPCTSSLEDFQNIFSGWTNLYNFLVFEGQLRYIYPIADKRMENL